MAYRKPASVIPQIQQDFREFGPIVTGFIFERNAQDGSVEQVYSALQAESDVLFKTLNSHMGPESVYRVLGDILGCILQDTLIVQKLQATYPPYELLKGTLDSAYLKGMVYAVSLKSSPPQPPAHHRLHHAQQRGPFVGYGSPHLPNPGHWSSPAPPNHHYPPAPNQFQQWHQPLPNPHMATQQMYPHPHQSPPSVFGAPPHPSVSRIPYHQPTAPTPVATQSPPVMCAVTKSVVRPVTHAPPSIDDAIEPSAPPPQPQEVCPLQSFLDEHSLGHLLEDLQDADITLPELRSLSLERFHARLRTIVCSQAMRTEVLQALHPSGKYPVDNQPSTATKSEFLSFMAANAITLKGNENATSKAQSQTDAIKSLLKLPATGDPSQGTSGSRPHTADTFETTVCRFYGRGSCIRGNTCKYAHIESPSDYHSEQRGRGRGRGGGRDTAGADPTTRGRGRGPRPDANVSVVVGHKEQPASYSAAVQGATNGTPDPQIRGEEPDRRRKANPRGERVEKGEKTERKR